MEKANIFIIMVLSILENGKMISSMDMEFKIGKMDKNTRDNIKMDPRLEKDF
jgi:hypothetical protein